MKAVVEMAREADGILLSDSEIFGLGFEFEIYQLERFAELVRADERDRAMRENAYVLAEREACAKLVDHILKEGGGTWGDAIRARGNT